MLPVDRTEGEASSPPEFMLAHGDGEGFLHELRGFHAAFHECFTRPEPRAHFFRYLVGQFSSLERKSIKPIALEVPGGNVRGMQRFVSDDVWDKVQMRHIYHQLVYEDLGAPDGVVIIDESGFPKKGKNSVGVARQYCESLGKVANCQVGMFAAYVSRNGCALVDKQLFLPEQWFSEAYAIRRARCKVPEDLRYQPQPQLAGAMVQTLYQEGTLPFRYVVTDCLYGNSVEFLEAVEACLELTCLVAIPADTRCWLQGPVTATRHPRYQDETRPLRTMVSIDSDPLSVEAIAQSLHDIFWYRRTVSTGIKGPMAYEFTKRRVTLCHNGRPDRTVWLVIKRTLGLEPLYWYYLSNAPLNTRLPTFVWLSGVRWAIEQCFEGAKTALGLHVGPFLSAAYD